MAYIKRLGKGTHNYNPKTLETSYEHHYELKGYASEALARAALLASISLVYEGCPITDVHCTEQFVGDSTAANLHLLSVTYHAPAWQTGSRSYQADLSGGTAHISSSLETIASYKATGFAYDPPDFKQLIGVSGDDDVQGVDIIVPAFKFQLTSYVSWDDFDQTYEDSLANLQGYVNNATLNILIHTDVTRSYPAGEVLFAGAQIAERQEQEDVAITFNFIRSPNVEGLTIGDITDINKRGHEVLWLYYSSKKDDDSESRIRRPIFAYVEKVYGTADLNGLV